MNDDGQRSGREILLSVPSDVKLLGLVRSTTRSVCQLVGFSEEETEAIVLAVYEACGNAILHGDANSETPLTVLFEPAAERLVVRVKNRGGPFEIDELPELDPSENRPGGRGVFLIKRLMDEVEAVKLAGGESEIRMLKRRAGR